MKYYPILLNIKDRLVAVIGGGEVALRKIKDLLDAEARIRVISPDMHEKILELADIHADRMELVNRKYKQGDLQGAGLAFSATDISSVNKLVFEEAEERNIFLNAVDDPPNCSFIIPSQVRRGDLILSLSTSGASPAMAARLRREIEKHIPDNIEIILFALRASREMLIQDSDFSSVDEKMRGEFFKKIVNDDDLLDELVLAAQSGNLDLKKFMKGLFRIL